MPVPPLARSPYGRRQLADLSVGQWKNNDFSNLTSLSASTHAPAGPCIQNSARRRSD